MHFVNSCCNAILVITVPAAYLPVKPNTPSQLYIMLTAASILPHVAKAQIFRGSFSTTFWSSKASYISEVAPSPPSSATRQCSLTSLLTKTKKCFILLHLVAGFPRELNHVIIVAIETFTARTQTGRNGFPKLGIAIAFGVVFEVWPFLLSSGPIEIERKIF